VDKIEAKQVIVKDGVVYANHYKDIRVWDAVVCKEDAHYLTYLPCSHSVSCPNATCITCAAHNSIDNASQNRTLMYNIDIAPERCNWIEVRFGFLYLITDKSVKTFDIQVC
jgi:hypothetical protein